MVEVRNIEENSMHLPQRASLSYMKDHCHAIVVAFSTDGAMRGVEVKLEKLRQQSPGFNNARMIRSKYTKPELLFARALLDCDDSMLSNS